MKKISILGATGSVGTQTLDVLRHESDNFILSGIAANKNYKKVISIIEEFHPKYVSLYDEKAYLVVQEYCKNNSKDTIILNGMEGLNAIATIPEVDIVVISVVGMVGLIPTLHAIRSGKNIALANKETLVVAGELITYEAEKNKIQLLPVDSEHGAIFQCLQGNNKNDINKIILTASGGPFRGKSKEELLNIKPEDALKHPNWNMGKKISVDSATLMNKGLEVIEAHWLFNVDYDHIEVVVHPQSIMHSAIEYKDGSIIAQMGVPDMRLPIQYALNYPKRTGKIVNNLDLFKTGTLTFEKPDTTTFKSLNLAFEVGRAGGTYPAILNGANEAAVELFLNNKISFLDIGNLVENCLNSIDGNNKVDVDNIINADKKARTYIYNTYGNNS